MITPTDYLKKKYFAVLKVFKQIDNWGIIAIVRREALVLTASVLKGNDSVQIQMSEIFHIFHNSTLTYI
jgi:hypothetical protein